MERGDIDRLTSKERRKFWEEKYAGKQPDWENEDLLRRKKVVLSPFFTELDRRGEIGNVVADIGSGYETMLQFLPDNPNRKLISVDLGVPDVSTENTRHLQYDLFNVADKRSFATRRALVEIADHLGIDARASDPAQVDTMIFSEALNYVDYKKVLREAGKYLKKGGRFIIQNMAHRGEKKDENLSEKAPETNQEVFDFLQEIGFEIEPTMYDEAQALRPEGMRIIVARKK